MEWLVLLAFIAVAVVLIALPPRGVIAGGSVADGASLADDRRTLLAELRELDEDAAAGRISAEDRQAGRRALAPRLRTVTESIRARGDHDESGDAR